MKKIMGAVFIGVIVAIVVGLYLRNEERKVRNHFQMTTVLKTKKYIPSGKLVAPELTEEVQVPVAFVEPNPLRTKKDLLDEKGQPKLKTRIEHLKGEPLVQSRLFEAGSLLSLSWTLSGQETAMALRLPFEAAGGGYLRPGDWVRVYAVFPESKESAARQSLLLLPRSKVLAVADQSWDPSGTADQAKNIGKSVENSDLVVTLMLNSKEAAVLAFAKEFGRIHLGLASPLGDEQASMLRVEWKDMLRGK